MVIIYYDDDIDYRKMQGKYLTCRMVMMLNSWTQTESSDPRIVRWNFNVHKWFDFCKCCDTRQVRCQTGYITLMKHNVKLFWALSKLRSGNVRKSDLILVWSNFMEFCWLWHMSAVPLVHLPRSSGFPRLFFIVSNQFLRAPSTLARNLDDQFKSKKAIRYIHTHTHTYRRTRCNLHKDNQY